MTTSNTVSASIKSALEYADMYSDPIDNIICSGELLGVTPQELRDHVANSDMWHTEPTGIYSYNRGLQIYTATDGRSFIRRAVY